MCFGAFLPARHVGRGFLRKRRMKFVEKCVAFFDKINYACNNNITYDYTAGMQMQKSLCDGTEWLVSNFNMLNA